MIPDETVFRRASDVRFRAVDDETVVIRQEAAEALVLNEVAGRILDLCDGRRTLAAIVAQLQEEYDVAAEELTADVQAYLQELVETGVVTRS
jgi:pyrroloquinoline quinone biosynthesis protein D